VCLCGFTESGHCGVLKEDDRIDNQRSIEILSKIALSHAECGADMVAPSDMMDNRIQAIKQTLI
jgi:porphobilinogen synthase